MAVSPTLHSPGGEAFQKALQRYIEETKPDQLVLKQIQSWEMEWEASDSMEEGNRPCHDLFFEPTDVLQGTLTWKSDYMIAEIECSCCWEPHHDKQSFQQSEKPNGSLYFVLRTKLRFRSQPGKGESKKSKDEKNPDEKILAKMIQRLNEDAYIQRLLRDDNTDDQKKSSSDAAAVILCTAQVTASNASSAWGQLEERVDVTDDVAEGLRRALFSQSESALDVIELLLSLPLLPGSAHDMNIHCPLADRARLRLLEDAMFDACEKEGEDELIDDLKISPPPADDSSGVDEKGAGKNHSKTRENQRNKRTKR